VEAAAQALATFVEEEGDMLMFDPAGKHGDVSKYLKHLQRVWQPGMSNQCNACASNTCLRLCICDMFF
jgi:hypothetical protein